MTDEQHYSDRHEADADEYERQQGHNHSKTLSDHQTKAVRSRWDKATPADRSAVGAMLAAARAKKREERQAIKDAADQSG